MKKLYQTNKIEKRDRIKILDYYLTRRSQEDDEVLWKEFSEKIDDILERAYSQRLGETWKKIRDKYSPSEDYSFKNCLIVDHNTDRYYEGDIYTEGLRLFRIQINYPPRFPLLLDGSGNYWDPLSETTKQDLLNDLRYLLDRKYKIFEELKNNKTLDLSKEIQIFPKAIIYDDLEKNYPEIYRYWIDNMTSKFGKLKIITVDEEIRNLRKFIV